MQGTWLLYTLLGLLLVLEWGLLRARRLLCPLLWLRLRGSTALGRGLRLRLF